MGQDPILCPIPPRCHCLPLETKASYYKLKLATLEWKVRLRGGGGDGLGGYHSREESKLQKIRKVLLFMGARALSGQSLDGLLSLKDALNPTLSFTQVSCMFPSLTNPWHLLCKILYW